MSKTYFVARDTGRVWSNREVKDIIESWHENPEFRCTYLTDMLAKKFASITGESNDE